MAFIRSIGNQSSSRAYNKRMQSDTKCPLRAHFAADAGRYVAATNFHIGVGLL
jgi:hypothetical protein